MSDVSLARAGQNFSSICQLIDAPYAAGADRGDQPGRKFFYSFFPDYIDAGVYIYKATNSPKDLYFTIFHLSKAEGKKSARRRIF